MAKKRLTVRDKLQKLQQASFVGRQDQLTSFQENLKRSDEEDVHFANIVNVYGQGGVGKTTLLRKFEEYAQAQNALVAYTDEAIKDVPAYMGAVAEQLVRLEKPLKKFSERYKVYRQKKQELEADPQAPTGIAGILGRTLVKGSLELAKGMPGGKMIVEQIDGDGLANQVGEWASFVAKKLTNKDEVQLVLEPEKVLTPIWLADLEEIAEKQRICLFIDTYEETASVLDVWLRQLIDNRYGDFDPNIMVTIAGRHKLPANDWSVFMPLTISLPVEPFTEKESSDFLDRHGIVDAHLRETIIRLSGNIPVLMATLAEASPKSADALTDVSNLAVERFLKWVTDPTKREIALHAATLTHINVDLLKQIAPPEQAETLFDWLQTMPFVQKRADLWTYHPIVRGQMLQYLQLRSRDNWMALHQKMAGYFEQKRDQLKLERKAAFRNSDWTQNSLLALYHRFCENHSAFLPEVVNGFLVALEENWSFAMQLATIMDMAEKDLKLEQRECWGLGLVEALTGYERNEYTLFESNLERISRSTFVEPENKPILLAWKAEINKKNQKYEEAISGFSQAIEINTDYEWAIALRGSLFRDLKRYDDALLDLDKAIGLNPEDEWNFAQRGLLFQDLQRYDDALLDFNKVIELNPEDEWSFTYRAILFQDMERYQDALLDFSKAIELHPKHAFNFALRGFLYKKLEQYNEALSDLNKAIALNPEDEWPIALRGSLFRDLKRYDEALLDLGKAIELKPDYEWAIALRGYLFQDLKRNEEALLDLNKAIDLNPEDEWALTIRGSLYLHLKRYEEALLDLNKAIDLNPEDEWAVELRVSLFQDIKRYDEALLDLNKVIDLTPEDKWALTVRGSLFRYLRRYDEALEELNKVIALKADYEPAIAVRGSVFLELKRYDEALKDLNRAIELNAENEWNLVQRGILFLNLNRNEEALEDLKKSIEIDPTNDWYLYFNYLVLQKACTLDDGAHHLEKAISLAVKYREDTPNDFRYHFNLAFYYLCKQNKDQAFDIIRQSLEQKVSIYFFTEFINDLENHLEILPDAVLVQEALVWSKQQLQNMN